MRAVRRRLLHRTSLHSVDGAHCSSTHSRWVHVSSIGQSSSASSMRSTSFRHSVSNSVPWNMEKGVPFFPMAAFHINVVATSVLELCIASGKTAHSVVILYERATFDARSGSRRAKSQPWPLGAGPTYECARQTPVHTHPEPAHVSETHSTRRFHERLHPRSPTTLSQHDVTKACPRAHTYG